MKVWAVPYIWYNINEYLKYFHIGRQFQICHSKKFMLEVTEIFFKYKYDLTYVFKKFQAPNVWFFWPVM